MQMNYWKFLNLIKDYVSKISNDKSVAAKDLLQVIRISSNELLKDSKYKDTRNFNYKLFLPRMVNVWSWKHSHPKKGEPKWKQKALQKTCVSEDSFLQSIERAETEATLLESIEALIIHIKNNPEARNRAIRIGAIRLLLRVKLKIGRNNTQLLGATREALSLLGYSYPVSGRGVRILSIDGGGIRGILVLEMLKKLEELTGNKVHEMFDFICGVSTGTILSFAMGIHHIPLDEISKGYERISNEVFKQSPLWGTSNLVWSHAYYNTSLWESKLKEYLGSDSLLSTSRNPHCPKLCGVSAVVNQARLSAFVFRNYTLPWRFQSQYMGTWDCEVWQAARASAAAPTYFEEYRLGNFIHQDGGILVNNPTAIAVHEVKLLWPNTPIQCVVSFGTGRNIFSPSESSTLPQETEVITNSTSWSEKFYRILDSATDTEAVHIMLSDLLPPHVYFRFNPYLTEMINMVETDPKKLEQLRRDALMYLRRNEDKFQDAAHALSQKKTYPQKVTDFINLNREMLGV